MRFERLRAEWPAGHLFGPWSTQPFSVLGTEFDLAAGCTQELRQPVSMPIHNLENPRYGDK